MVSETRRRFLAHFSGMGLGSTLLPGVLWAQMQEANANKVTLEMLQGALAMSGLEFSEEDEREMLDGVNSSLETTIELRKIHIPNDVSPPYHFSAIVPGIKVNKESRPFRMSSTSPRRPANVEDMAFWSITDMSQLLRSGQVKSQELTEMYLDRLRRYNPKLNCVVTFLDDIALQQARQADTEIAAGHYRGPLHGVPWGAKDIISVAGYRTTWGSDAYKDQVFDYDASVVEILRDAGAVLLAKLASGELASGDQWWGGQTKNPWNLEEGSSGSSAGPGSATGGGCVGFSIGTETSGSILSPSGRCGVTGLRPTLGRISRAGVMALSWTQDRLGPMTRYAEDCALVMNSIARPDGKDMSVVDLPFNWDAQQPIRNLRVGYLKEGFDEVDDDEARRDNEEVLANLRKMGFDLIPVTVPDFPSSFSAIGVESSAFFYELIQSGRDKLLTRPNRGLGMKRARLEPAVEYLQHQRLRMMMMMKLAEATSHVDVYVTPRTARRGGPPRTAAAAGGRTAAGGPPTAAGPAGTPGRGGGPPDQPQSATRAHSSMANLATYPAISIPHGFYDTGSPKAVVFFAQPFRETELLSLVKAYQDATGYHLKHPDLDNA